MHQGVYKALSVVDKNKNKPPPPETKCPMINQWLNKCMVYSLDEVIGSHKNSVLKIYYHEQMF